MNSTRTHDLIISGGGMVGLALAVGAAQAGLKIALIEQTVPASPINKNGQYSPRVSAINHASERLLTNLGAWQRIPESRKAMYQGMQVWDGLGQGQINFDAQDVQRQHLGYIVENSFITDALWEQVFDQPSIEIFTNDRVKTWQQNEQQVSVVSQNNQQLCAQLLIAAEGKFSAIREQSTIDTWQWDYQHQAIVTTVQHALPHQQVARQVFLESGPLAFLPLSDDAEGNHYSSIVWSAKTERANELLALTDEAFQAQLNTAFEHKLGKVRLVDQRYHFGLTALQTKKYFDHRVVVLGDAAHAIHPLAGLGVNLGFLDVAALLEQLQRANDRNINVGHAFVLRRYQRQRQRHNISVASAMEALKRTFDSQHPLPVIVRNTGLNWLDRSQVLKRPLILAALGDLGSELPTLCRP